MAHRTDYQGTVGLLTNSFVRLQSTNSFCFDQCHHLMRWFEGRFQSVLWQVDFFQSPLKWKLLSFLEVQMMKIRVLGWPEHCSSVPKAYNCVQYLPFVEKAFPLSFGQGPGRKWMVLSKGFIWREFHARTAYRGNKSLESRDRGYPTGCKNSTPARG